MRLMLKMLKKAALEHLLMLVTIVIFESNQNPKFFALSTELMELSPILKELKLTFASCYRVPMIKNSVFLPLTFNLSGSIQSLISSMQCSKAATAAS